MDYKLPVKKLYPDAKLPERAHPQDVGLDLFAYEGFKIYSGQTLTVGTGISIQVPESFAGYVQSRSGWARKRSIFVLNSPGLIDRGYTGELKVILHFQYNPEHDKYRYYEFTKADKIAQLVLVPAPRFEPVLVESLEESERGDSGFGSTDEYWYGTEYNDGNKKAEEDIQLSLLAESEGRAQANG